MLEQDKAAQRPALILIVEDDHLQRSLIRECLEVAGFACAEAEDGDDGLEQCLALDPDLVILDVMMPGRDGYSVCAEIRRNPKTCNIPVLMVTGLEDVDSVERSFQAGATNFLMKPINFPLLPYTLKYMLRSSAMEQKIQEARCLAEDSSAAKSQFLATMSHELRTPLNAILGFSEMVFTEVLGPEGYPRYLTYAKDIHESAEHLLQIVGDILDLSKIDSGKLELREDVASVVDLVEQAVSMVQHRAKEAGLDLQLQIAEDLPLLRIDVLRLKQVLINIMGNSIKFTPSGGKVSIRARAESDGQLALVVEDNGIGIAPDQLEKALSPFGQVDGDLNRNYEGTGLGLTISKRLAKLLGVHFKIESQVGCGTAVTLRFPAELLCPGETVRERRLAS